MIPFTDPETGLRDYRRHAPTPPRWPWLVIAAGVLIWLLATLRGAA